MNLIFIYFSNHIGRVPLLLLFLLVVGAGVAAADDTRGAGTEAEKEAFILLSIKANLTDPMNMLKDWEITNGNNNSSHCNWSGVGCNSNGYVDSLQLSNMNLSGTLSPTIQALTRLSYLHICCNAFQDTSLPPNSFSNLNSLKTVDVSQNNFMGSFPTGLGMASGLTYLNASSNDFSGFLPEDLGNATELQVLDFRGSFFQGSIPTSFSNLKMLKYLGLSGNNLTGKIPPQLGQLSSLETIILGYNEFEGEIPEELGNLTNLQYLDLAVGSLSGQIPPTLGKLQMLTTVYLYKNNLTGNIPPQLGNVTSLVFLDLSDNQISGKFPEELAELSNLQLLNLMRNQLTGSIPPKLGQLTKLQVLELWQNSLTGSLPINLGQNSPLQLLDVSSNSLSGEIPPGLCNSGNLTKLILFNNTFTGAIPVSLSTCNSLVRVRIQHNLISGRVPCGFGSLPSLQRLELANNNLSGRIPDDITMSTSLSFIDFSGNHLVSSLTSSIFSITNLQTFLVSRNNLVGKIPDQFQDCPSLSVVDLSGNHLTGEIPESIASCEKLVNLNLRNNQLTGDIPTSLATMPTLAILDLSNNSLVGHIPDNLGNSPALEMLNLSYNRFSGPVPSNGLFTTINPDDLVGNAGLCGGILPAACFQNLRKVSPGRARNLHIKHVITGFIIGTCVVLSLGLAFFTGRFFYHKWYLYNSVFSDIIMFKKDSQEWPWRLVAFQRVGFTTNDILSSIKESNIVGMGGTGIVYKAEVLHPHGLVAVKKICRSEPDDVEYLFAEVSLLGRPRHRNIVRLLGYIHNENDVMMISEYMPNGNLWTALQGKQLLVDWVSRYNIAHGVAQGLRYLHHDCHPPVIHRDIKSNNILLDANLDARIADFGLARMMAYKNVTVSMVAGSYGYIAPEYGYTLKVDEKTDIYSFGVLLLELLTGKMPLDPSFGETTDIVEWVRTKVKNNRATEEALDPSLASQFKHVQEEMLLVLRIALVCTAKLPKDRPSMRDVIAMLGEAKPRRKSVCQSQSQTQTQNGGNINSNKEKPIFSTSPAAIG